jgi:hypothetical protein
MRTTDRNVFPVTDRTAFRNWLLALVATAIVTATCVAWVDRPAAELFDRHFPQAEWRLWIDRLVTPFEAGVLAALVFLLACGAWVISGRRLASWTRMLMLCSWAAMWRPQPILSSNTSSAAAGSTPLISATIYTAFISSTAAHIGTAFRQEPRRSLRQSQPCSGS